jgi:predicted dehydrogenase
MKTTYAVIGLGGRSSFFYSALATDFKNTTQIVAFCDVNQTRMDYANFQLNKQGYPEVPTYEASNFNQMIHETKPDIVIVTTIDRTHHTYIVRAMELGCNVISEKPMTIDEDRCEEILNTIKRTGKELRVTFNYRYAPHNTKVYQLLGESVIGQVNAAHFEWALNTAHGADYFRRWHRDKRNSGGLLVHKSTHHFDLMNFWLRSRPKTVVAMGELAFYGKANAEKRGLMKSYSRTRGSENARGDPFALDMTKYEQLKAMYLDAEHEDGYYRDQSVFGDGISIEDTMGVMVRYQSGVIMTYNLIAYAPWEGFRVRFSGSQGQLELHVVENSYVNSGGEQKLEGAADEIKLTLHRLFEPPQDIEIVTGEGGHGGGDPELLKDLFGGAKDDEFKRAASHLDGAMSILTGIAANRSMSTGQVVQVKDIFNLP